jgi:trypsin-like peptidase
MMRQVLLIALALTMYQHSGSAQDLNRVKAAVVKIENSNGDTGTGFVIKIDGRNVYILTAAHVVKGNHRPRIYLFSQPHDPLSAILLDREEDDSKGLALLLLKTDGPAGDRITPLKLRGTNELGNGESVMVIGFPDGTSIWTVESLNLKRLQGRDLILSQGIREGTSGAPVLLNQEVVGLVTDIGQADARATRAEIIIPYVNGIVRNLIVLGKLEANSPPTTKGLSVSEATVLVDALKNTRWLEHGSTINGEKIYREFEFNGFVRTRTQSDDKGYIAVNVNWHLNNRTLYLQEFDIDTKRLLLECSGTLQVTRIEGQCKNLRTGTSSEWLLTRFE